MEGLPDNQAESESQPTVQIIKKSFFQTKKGISILVVGCAVTIFIILLITLNYFQFIFLPLSSLPQKMTLNCPLLNQDCSQSQSVKLNDKPAIGYQLPPQSKVINPTKISDIRQFILPPFEKNSPIGINQSFIVGNTCYTITYTVPYDANIATVNILPLSIGAQIITLGSQVIKVEDKDLNLVLQLQKRPLESGGKTEQQKCPVYSLDSTRFGEYEQINMNLFKK